MFISQSPKKTIVLFCRHFDVRKNPFKHPYYWNAYVDLLLTLRKLGADAYFATGNNTYAGNGVFTTAYTSDRKVPIKQFQSFSNIKANLVYDKGGFKGEDVLVLNNPFVHAIASDKIETYKHFSEYQAVSFACYSHEELTHALEKVKSERVVIKAPVSNGGNKVFIGKKTELLSKNLPHYPLLVQEFIDTSIGIKGLVDGVHDIRVKLGGGNIWGGTLRQPAKGELRANVAQGGTERHLWPEEIPADVKHLAIRIDGYFKDYPRYIAADFANTPEGWKLIELNNKPGLSPIDSNPQSKHITTTLAQYLLSLA